MTDDKKKINFLKNYMASIQKDSCYDNDGWGGVPGERPTRLKILVEKYQ